MTRRHDDPVVQERLLELLKAVVARHGGKQQAAADELEMHQPQVSKILAGKSAIPASAAPALARATGESLDEIYDHRPLVRRAVATEAAVATEPPPPQAPPRPTPRTLAEALDRFFERFSDNHSIEDACAVVAALGELHRFAPGEDPVAVARAWLDAARDLRQRGVYASPAVLAEEFERHATLPAPALGVPADNEAAVGTSVPLSPNYIDYSTGPTAASGVRVRDPEEVERLQKQFAAQSRGAK